METAKFDYIFSVSKPFTCNIIASWIKDKYPELKWIVYEVDPFVYNYNQKSCLLNSRKKIALKTYKTADYFFCMPGIIEENKSRNYFPYYMEKAIDLELPILEKNNDIKDDNFFNKDYINCVYTGIFYKSIRNPLNLLEFFSKTEKNVRLHIFGAGCDDILNKYKLILGDRLVLHGYLSNSVCEKAIINADILINLGNSVKNQIPSKLFSYIATGKPIVNFATVDYDSCDKYLQAYNNFMRINLLNYGDNDIILFNEYVSAKKEDLPYSIVEQRCSTFTLKSTVNKFFKTINL